MAICRECWAEALLIAPAGKVLLIVSRKPGMVRPRSTVAGNAEGAGRSWHAALLRPPSRWPQDHWPREPVIPLKAHPLRVCKISEKSKDQLMLLLRGTPRSSRNRDERSRTLVRRAHIAGPRPRETVRWLGGIIWIPKISSYQR